jgi:hypothetical protein
MLRSGKMILRPLRKVSGRHGAMYLRAMITSKNFHMVWKSL